MKISIRNRARFFYDEIRRVMLNDWDPIGVGHIPEAQDEYDSYVPAICKMLMSQKPQQEIFDYLWWLETEHMGLTGDRQTTENFSNQLMQIPLVFSKIDSIESKNTHH